MNDLKVNNVENDISRSFVMESAPKILGNSPKFLYDDFWYKVDTGCGYHGVAETTASLLLARTNLEKDYSFSYVRYSFGEILYEGKMAFACKSKNFLKDNETVVTLFELLRVYNNNLFSFLKYPSIPLKERLVFLVQCVEEITGLDRFDEYLGLMLEFDYLVLNSDRHLNNIAFIRREDGTFNYCPLFDHGMSLFADMYVPGDPVMTPRKYMKSIPSKPFSVNFTSMLKAVRKTFGRQLRFQKLSETELDYLLSFVRNEYREEYAEEIISNIKSCVMTQQKKF